MSDKDENDPMQNQSLSMNKRFSSNDSSEEEQVDQGIKKAKLQGQLSHFLIV